MNEKEEIIRSNIATCKCCFLAQAMRDCTLCRFNIGLVEEVHLINPIPLKIHIKAKEYIAVFAMTE